MKNETKFEQDNKKQKNKKRTGKWRRNNVDLKKKGDFASTHRERERRKTGGRMKKEGSCWPTLRQPTTRWQGACSRRYYFHFSSPMLRSPFLSTPQPENKEKKRRISFFFCCCSYQEGGGKDIIVTDRRENPKDERREILRRRSTISAWNVNIPSFRINKKSREEKKKNLKMFLLASDPDDFSPKKKKVKRMK